MLQSVVGKVFCKIKLEQLDKGGVLHEGQAGFRRCIDNVYTLNELVEGRLREDSVFKRCKQSLRYSLCDGLW